MTLYDLAYGIGLYVPFGLTSQWGEEFPGRFAAQKASLKTLYVQPNVAFQLTDNWSIGWTFLRLPFYLTLRLK